MRLAYENFLEWFPLEEELVVTSFTSRCKDLQINVGSEFTNISIPPVDFEKAKREAIKKATHEETYTVKVKKSGIFNTIKSWFGATSAYIDEVHKRPVVDEKRQIIEERNEILKQVRDALKSYCKKFKTNFIDPTANNINLQLKTLVVAKQGEYDKIREASLNAEEHQRMIDLVRNELSIIEEADEKVCSLQIKN